MDERRLIEAVQAGDGKSFAYLVSRYERMAYTIAFRILGNREEAEEAAQDAFVRAYRALPRFRFESKFSTWLYRIVYRVSLTVASGRLPVEETPIEEVEDVGSEERDSAIELLQSRQRKTIVREALARLSPNDALVMTLFYLEGCSIEEIRQITSLSLPTIKTRLCRARKRLFELLKERMGSEINNLL